jgi:hypothetical protein
VTGRSKPGLDISRHQEIGLELARIRDRLTTLGVEVANAYPKSSRLSRLALAMPGSVDKARSALDNQVCAEHPADPDTTYWYYPQSKVRWPEPWATTADDDPDGRPIGEVPPW